MDYFTQACVDDPGPPCTHEIILLAETLVLWHIVHKMKPLDLHVT